MASPGRAQPRPLTPSTTSSTSSRSSTTTSSLPLPLRAKLSSMTYSFAQQMPQLPSRPRKPEDPNFPHLPGEPTTARAWDPPAAKPAWPSQSSAKATAAEVVAGAVKNVETKVEGPDHADEERHQAELELYSKLVPTTSAVPRNPGRSLGGGGLRATGSVAAQKSRPVSAGTPLTAPQSLPREPMASRMRSLSSEASKPQLARRVAKPIRTPSTTPPQATSETPIVGDLAPTAAAEPEHPNIETPRTERAKTSSAAGNALARPSPRELRSENEDAYLKSIRSIYGNVERETIRPVSRNEGSGAPAGQKGSEGPIPPRPRAQPSRRLEEAFKAPSPPPSTRYEGRRSPSPVPSRKDQIGALRRSSALPPPPGLPAVPRKCSGRDGAAIPVKNGRKASGQDSPAHAPPGFEARTATVSRSAFLGRGKADSEGPSDSKSGEREREQTPARPQNARAHAFREAINTRRHSSSPRSSSSRRVSAGGANSGVGHESAGKKGSSGREDSRLRNSDKEVSRPMSFPAKQSSTLSRSVSQDGGRSRRKSDHVTANLKRDEKIMQRRLERPAARPVAAFAPAESRPKTGAEAPPLKTNRTDSTINGSTVYNRHVDKKLNTRPDNGQFKSLPASKEEYIFAGAANGGPTQKIQAPKVISYPGRDPSELPMEKSALEAHHVNGWSSDGTNGVSDDHAEAFVNHLLEHEEDDFIPGGSTSRAVPTGPSAGPSMIDLMRQLHANAAMSSALSNSEKHEDVLPPLPNSEEDVRFETMLRSMGWTPPEEDETPKDPENNGVTLPIRQASSTGVRAGVSDIGLTPGLRNVENGKIQSPYYSHFQ